MLPPATRRAVVVHMVASGCRCCSIQPGSVRCFCLVFSRHPPLNFVIRHSSPQKGATRTEKQWETLNLYENETERNGFLIPYEGRAGSGGGQGFPIMRLALITRPLSCWSKRSWRSCRRMSRLRRHRSPCRTRRSRACRSRGRFRTSTVSRGKPRGRRTRGWGAKTNGKHEKRNSARMVIKKKKSRSCVSLVVVRSAGWRVSAVCMKRDRYCITQRKCTYAQRRVL